MKFSSFDLSPTLLESIGYMGFDEATPIQENAIPAVLTGKDLIACAQTGTGKTAAYLIPTIEKVSQSEGNHIKCIILCPTRELAAQIDQNLQGIAYFCGVTSQAVYGGNQSEEFTQQKTSIQSGVDILVATPGRLIAHCNLGYVDLSKVECLILDEADRMLDMGFVSDILKINGLLPEKKQTLLFSATMAAGIRKLAVQILHEPQQINLAIAKPAAGINQQAYMALDENKVALLEHILTTQEVKNMIVFASSKLSVDKIHTRLARAGLKVKSIHSGKEQAERNETLRLFKAGEFNVLVATDILSRGIDIDDLSHVVNYDVPDDPADYVHRIGRTARAGKSGAAITFINTKDQFLFYCIEQLIERELEKIPTPEAIGESPEYSPSIKNKKKKRRKNNKPKSSRNQSQQKGKQRKKETKINQEKSINQNAKTDPENTSNENTQEKQESRGSFKPVLKKKNQQPQENTVPTSNDAGE